MKRQGSKQKCQSYKLLELSLSHPEKALRDIYGTRLNQTLSSFSKNKT